MLPVVSRRMVESANGSRYREGSVKRGPFDCALLSEAKQKSIAKMYVMATKGGLNMIPYKTSIFDIVEEIKECFNYYSLNDINLIYEYIKKNETNVNGVHYDRAKNIIGFNSKPDDGSE